MGSEVIFFHNPLPLSIDTLSVPYAQSNKSTRYLLYLIPHATPNLAWRGIKLAYLYVASNIETNRLARKPNTLRVSAQLLFTDTMDLVVGMGYNVAKNQRPSSLLSEELGLYGC